MNADLFSELVEMKRRDLEVRARLVGEGRLYGEYAEEMQQVHIENAHRLDAIVTKYGWPNLSLVELEGTRAAWLIAQHSICTPGLQRKFLALITEAARAGEVPKLQVAFLTDRVRAAEGRPQLYGTVLDWNESGELSCEVEDPPNLDMRRQEVGLSAFADDLASHRREVEAEGGKPPADLAAWQQGRLEWAKRVGWID
jgi:hypothetical protein